MLVLLEFSLLVKPEPRTGSAGDTDHIRGALRAPGQSRGHSQHLTRRIGETHVAHGLTDFVNFHANVELTRVGLLDDWVDSPHQGEPARDTDVAAHRQDRHLGTKFSHP